MKSITFYFQQRFSPLLVTLFITALLVRIALLFVPGFSTDPQRFLSDGINLLEGRNPYTAAPALPITYGHLRSFYTPLMEGFFAFGAWLMHDPFVFRLLGGAAELLFLGWFFVRRRSRPLPLLLTLFLLFNPVSLHEIWREGHLDHIGAFFLYFAVVSGRSAFAHRRGKLRGLLFLLLSIAWKFTGIIALAFRLRKLGSSPVQRTVLRLADSFVWMGIAAFALQLLPVYLFTQFAERGLTVYTTYWHHGNGIVHLLHGLGFADAHGIYLVQRLILLALLLIGGLYLTGRLSYTNTLCLGLGTLLVLFPVQHPWYYFMLFPFILLYRRWRKPFMVLCCLAPLSYLGYTASLKSTGFWIMLVFWLFVIIRLPARQPGA
ncbi:MAG TPA: hypothetical protein PLF85_05925 [Turneriella sp.]|nr:hypothetical protein [Turneriella sp.]